MKVNLRTRSACLQLALGLLVTGAALPQQTSNTPPLAGLTPDHATISVGDIQKESAWYQSVLGFKVSQSFTNEGGAPIQILTIPGYRLDLVEYKGSTRATYTYSRYMTQGWIHLVFTVPDISAAYRSLQDLKTDVTATKNAKGDVDHLIVRDPEGNEFELFQRP
jgi:catechol 2,3-dioxygenase-like lactoylglutathione lyase family enzyme